MLRSCLFLQECRTVAFKHRTASVCFKVDPDIVQMQRKTCCWELWRSPSRQEMVKWCIFYNVQLEFFYFLLQVLYKVKVQFSLFPKEQKSYNWNTQNRTVTDTLYSESVFIQCISFYKRKEKGGAWLVLSRTASTTLMVILTYTFNCTVINYCTILSLVPSINPTLISKCETNVGMYKCGALFGQICSHN